jgi:hypothetical protein
VVELLWLIGSVLQARSSARLERYLDTSQRKFCHPLLHSATARYPCGSARI